MNPYVGFALRIATFAILAGLATLKVVIGDGLTATDVVDVIQNAWSAGATYAGIGAATPLEPRVGIFKQ